MMNIAQSFRRTSSIVRFLAAVLVISASPARAAVGVWTPLGPDSAGIFALAVHPEDPRILYAGTQTGGVFKSIDGGATWRPSNAGLGGGTPNAGLRALVIDPRDPDTVYAATLNDGIFRSGDGGRSWVPASQGLPRAGAGFQWIFSLILDPRSPHTLYAGGLGGVFRSTDGGRTWKPRRAGLPEGRSIWTLALDPATGMLWAGCDLAGGVFRSADQGKSWKASSSGIPTGPIVSLAIDPGDPRRLLAGTTDGLFRSTDTGRSWKRVAKVLTGRVVEAVLFQTSRLVYAGTLRTGVFRSTDGGVTWARATEGITDRDILVLAAGPHEIYAGTSGQFRPGGVFRSLDRGATWGPLQRGLSTVPVKEIAVDPTDRGVLYASAPMLGIFKSSDGGTHWSVLDLGILPATATSISSLVIDPERPSTIYAANPLFGPLLRSDDEGATWQVFNAHLILEDLLLDPGTPGALWGAGDGGLYHSEDEGATWTRQPLQPEGYFQFQDIQADPRDPRILYVSGATLFGARIVQLQPRIFRSADGGQTWERRDTGLADTDGRIVDLVLDPVDPSTLYASANGTLYRSTDAGISWAPLPGLQRVTVLAAAPSSPPAIYAAQDGIGIARSTDRGETWTPIRRGLGEHRVLVLRPDPHTPERIFAGTADGGTFTYTLP